MGRADEGVLGVGRVGSYREPADVASGVEATRRGLDGVAGLGVAGLVRGRAGQTCAGKGLL